MATRWGIGAPGKAGAAGRGITSATVNGSGHLIITYTDASTVDAGYVIGGTGSPGTPGTAGRGITSTAITGGHLVLTYTDSTTQDVGQVIGVAGPVGSFASVTATGLASGANPTATLGGTAPNQTLALGIPAGATGPAGPAAIAASIPARAFGTAFQPHATKPVYVSYTVKTQVTNPLLAGSSTATVQLLSDASNPPTTERARTEAGSSVGLTVSIALTTWNSGPLPYIVPPGHYVKLVSTVTGTGATSIVSQVEEVLG